MVLLPNSPVKKERSALVAVLVIALAVRLGIGVFLGFNSPPDKAACGADTIEFEHMAWSAAQGKGFVAYEKNGLTAFRAPGYPMMLAVLYRLFGRAYFVNRIALSLVGTAACWLVYLLSVRLGLSKWTALLTAFITAVLPLQFYYCGHFMSEPVAACLNVASALLLAITFSGDTAGKERRTSGRQYVLLFAAGLVCGASALIRAAALLVPIALAGLLLVSRRVPLHKSVLWSVIFLGGTILAVAPWTVRNKIVFDRFSLIATNGGSTFWGANNRIVASPGRAWGGWISTNFDRERKEREVWPLPNEVDRDRKEWRIGLEFLAKHPGRIPSLLTGKFYRLIFAPPSSANRVYVYIVTLGQLFLLPASVLGIVLAVTNGCFRKTLIPVNAQLLALIATTAIFYGSERFRASYEPFLAIYAAFGVVWVAGKVRGKGVESPGPKVEG